MRYQNVCLESLAYTLPDEVVTSAAIESQLTPLYERLRLPEGRLELMTGIRERRFWPPGTLPSQPSVVSAEAAIRQAGIDRGLVGALVHGSLCRDYIEPATASCVHDRLGLSPDCMVYDLSNACLGLLDGIVQVANMIELGQIQAGIVVGTESSRGLVENTIRRLNTDLGLSRALIKPAMASLTVGSASAAAVLVDRRISRKGHQLLGGAVRANTRQCRLCHGGQDPSSGVQAELLMWTDSESLLQEGVATAAAVYPRFLESLGWRDKPIQKTFCHQVGRAHRKLLMETLGLDPAIDYSTLEWLGNTGSVAVPITAAVGIERGHVAAGDRVALLGIGSGINVVMLGLEWGASRAQSDRDRNS